MSTAQGVRTCPGLRASRSKPQLDDPPGSHGGQRGEQRLYSQFRSAVGGVVGNDVGVELLARGAVARNRLVCAATSSVELRNDPLFSRSPAVRTGRALDVNAYS